MIIFTRLDRCADTVLKPGIFKAAVHFYAATAAVCQRGVVTAAKFMQQVGFEINICFGVDVFAQIKT